MKAGWQTVKLSDVSELLADGDWIESKDQSDDGIRLIQTGNIGDGTFKDREEKARYISESTFKRLRCTEIFEGDCLVSRLPEPVGRSCILPAIPRSITAVDCSIIRFNKRTILPEFFCYFSQSRDYQTSVESKTSGTTRKRISRSHLSDIEIPLPPLAEQKRIVALLDEAFAGIDEAKAKAEESLRDTKTLMESHLEAAFTERDRDWKDKTLSELCERITKGSSPKWQGISYVKTPGVLFVTSENVGENEILLDEPKYVEEKFNLKDKKSILKNGDVLTNIVGASIGRTAVFNRNDPANINQAVCLLRCRPDSLNNHYLAYLLNSPVFKRLLHDNEIDTARANLSLSFFSKLSVPVPPLLKQNQVVSKIEAFRKQAEHLSKLSHQKLTALNNLKKSALTQAFAGELTA